ncbi:MAG: Gmad2 immunoglobulin-like domain-containing protein [Patescibacteria group bacterium]
MVTSNKKFGRKSPKKTLLVLVAVLITAGAAYGAYNYLHNRNQPAAAADAGPTTSAKNNAAHKEVASSTFNQGGAVDKKGAATSEDQTTDASKWTVSTSGSITLQQPTADSTLNSGDTIRGTAQVDTVQYRLVDDYSGVLAQGSLSVVGGKFSGTLQFKPYGSTGSLKVFSIDPSSGAEINHADIKLKLAP